MKLKPYLVCLLYKFKKLKKDIKPKYLFWKEELTLGLLIVYCFILFVLILIFCGNK